MGRCKWEARAPGKPPPSSALARCKVDGAHGKYEQGSSPSTWKRDIPENVKNFDREDDPESWYFERGDEPAR